MNPHIEEVATWPETWQRHTIKLSQGREETFLCKSKRDVCLSEILKKVETCLIT